MKRQVLETADGCYVSAASLTSIHGNVWRCGSASMDMIDKTDMIDRQEELRNWSFSLWDCCIGAPNSPAAWAKGPKDSRGGGGGACTSLSVCSERENLPCLSDEAHQALQPDPSLSLSLSSRISVLHLVSLASAPQPSSLWLAAQSRQGEQS